MTASNRTVTLEEVLTSREARVARQREMLARGGVVVSFTVNMPGPVKDTEDARTIFREGVAAFERAARDAGLAVQDRRELFLSTGPEGLFRCDADALAVKKAAVAVETTHPLGRLFDMDVLDASGAAVSRSVLGEPVRRCLVCGNAAAVCGRSRAHGVDALLAAIRALVASAT